MPRMWWWSMHLRTDWCTGKPRISAWYRLCSRKRPPFLFLITLLTADMPISETTSIIMYKYRWKWLFGFPKVKLLYIWQVKWTKSVRYPCQIFSRFNLPKSLKSVDFWQSYSKNRKGGRFLEHSVNIIIILMQLLNETLLCNNLHKCKE